MDIIINVERIRKRWQARFDEEPDSWVTVNGNHIPLDEDKNPIGGQQKAFGKWKLLSGKKNSAKKVKRQKGGGEDFSKKRASWRDGKDIREKVSVELTESELNKCGGGFSVIDKNGETYRKSWGGNWVRESDGKTVSASDIGKCKFSGDYYDLNYGMMGMNSDQVDILRATVETMPEKAKDKYYNVMRNKDVVGSDEYSFYSEEDDAIHIIEGMSAEESLHEMTHALDNGSIRIYDESTGDEISSVSKYIDSLVGPQGEDEDFETMAKVIGFRTDGNGFFADNQAMREAKEKFNRWAQSVNRDSGKPYMNGFDAVSDVVDAMTLSEIDGVNNYGGHDKEYWLGDTKSCGTRPSSEYWARFCTCVFFGYTDALKVLKKITPNKYASAEQAFREAFS